MRKRNLFILGLLSATVLGTTGWVTAWNDMERKLFEFEIGKTLKETAARTRLPLSGQNSWGMITAASPQFPNDVYGKYAQPGYEIMAGPLTSIMFFSDVDRYPNKETHTASLSIDTSQPGFSTYAELYDYVYALIGQFQNGKWQRYYPDHCPHLSGRFSIIDQKEVESLAVPELKNWVGFGCPIDPAYKPPLEEWKPIVDASQRYMWHDGQGHIATLTVRVGDNRQDGTLEAYSDTHVDLEFELEENIRARAAGNREAELKEPWGARVPKVEVEERRIRAILEQRANAAAASTAEEPVLRAKAGSPCPRSGIWQSQNAKAEQRFCKEGDSLPDLDSAYGVTVWQWVK